MRFYTTAPYRTPQHFLGAVQAMKQVGPGAFLISPGDIDPPEAVREVISAVLGPQYPWYPMMGNHELGKPEYVAWLEKYNDGGARLPHVVRKGPPGSEETTFSFDWANCHFVVLNQYYDGKTDAAPTADVVPELLAWLEADLAANTKTHVFVFGHEPMMAFPDMDNGRVRHAGDSLDANPAGAFRFQRLLLEHRVAAYLCGHTHNTSIANINGVWQLDSGHARGLEEDSSPDELFAMSSRAVQEGAANGLSTGQALAQFYAGHKVQVQKAVFYLRLAEGAADYKSVTDAAALAGLSRFFADYQQGGATRDRHVRTFWANVQYTRSTFLKMYAGRDKVKVEIYRDDGRGGPYGLRRTVVLQ
jgi:hypothetical protein